jgi:hypothetical protein
MSFTVVDIKKFRPCFSRQLERIKVQQLGNFFYGIDVSAALWHPPI